MKQDNMQNLTLRRLEIDPNELMSNGNIMASPMNSSQAASCFACFSIKSKSKK
jgi:hypothetical protein